MNQSLLFLSISSEQKAEFIVDGLADKLMLARELELIDKNNINWITFLNVTYPALLKGIAVPPAVLYWQGASLQDDTYNIAVIGARAATAYGQQAIQHIVPTLVDCGWTIVSGGAIGADTMAHRTTLDAGGKTIAVLGSGLLMPYPNSNKRLFQEIIECGGSVVSTFPLTMGALPGNFPARNRIISGLSKGCVVIQAAAKSGAIITAMYALEQGRDVFAIPGPFYDPLSAGCHWLLQQGAKLVCKPEDILQEFGRIDASILEKSPQQVSFKPVKQVVEENPIIKACREPISLEEISQATGFALSELHLKLFELQIEGKVQQNFAGLWEKV